MRESITPREVMPRIPEKAIQGQILSMLKLSGYFVWRQNSGFFKRDKHSYAMTIKGAPDIIGMTPSGRFLGIEVKAKGGKQNPNQIDFQRQCEESNGLYILAYSPDQVVQALKEAGERIDVEL